MEYCPHCRGSFYMIKPKDNICPFCNDPVVVNPKQEALKIAVKQDSFYGMTTLTKGKIS